MRDTSGLRIPVSYLISLVRGFGELLQDHGSPVDFEALEEAAPTGQAKIELLFTLMTALNERLGPDWPVRASFAWRSQMHGTIDVAARSARTLGEALDVFGTYGHVRAPFAEITMRETHSHRIFAYTPAVPMDEAHWQALAEFTMLASLAILHQATDNRLSSASVTMPERGYEHRRLLEDALQVPVTFGGNGFSIRFEKTACAAVLPFSDSALFNAAVQQLEEGAIQLASHSWLIGDIRSLIAAHKGTRPSAASVAKALGMSQRSLVRNLAAEGTSFRALLDDYLQQRAATLMERGDMTFEQIAEELGYSDRTSFARARRRWMANAEG